MRTLIAILLLYWLFCMLPIGRATELRDGMAAVEPVSPPRKGPCRDEMALAGFSPSRESSGQGVCGQVAASPPTLSPPAPLVIQVKMTVSSYCPCRRCCGRFADGITASGKPVTANGGKFCAADKSIPFGTMIEIPGYGLVPVLDRGGAIKGKKIDVFYEGHKEAIAWGRQNLAVKIYKKEKA